MSSNESFRSMAHAGCALTICSCRDGREVLSLFHLCSALLRDCGEALAGFLRPPEVSYSFDRIHPRDLHHILQACPCQQVTGDKKKLTLACHSPKLSRFGAVA